MSLRNKLAERARPYLAPDEQIQAVFIAQSGPSPYWAFLVGLAFAIPYCMVYAFKLQHSGVGLVLLLVLVVTYIVVVRLVFPILHFVVTDRAITVLHASWLATFPRQLRQRHPRTVYFGLRKSGLWGTFELDNTKYWVRSRFQKDLAAADAALTAMTQRGQPGLVTASPVGQQPVTLPPAGWYPDPTGGSDMRYWDGAQWAPLQQKRFH